MFFFAVKEGLQNDLTLRSEFIFVLTDFFSQGIHNRGLFHENASTFKLGMRNQKGEVGEADISRKLPALPYFLILYLS